MTKAPGSGSGPSSFSVPWRRPDVGLLIAASAFVVALGVILLWPVYRVRIGVMPAWLGPTVDTLVLLAPLVVGAVLAARVGGPRIARALGLSFRAVDIVLGLAVALVARAVMETVAPTVGSLLPPFADSEADRIAVAVVAAVGSALLVPLAEEVFFRGALQRSLHAWIVGVAGPRIAAVVAVILATIAFVLLHAAPYGGSVPVSVVLPPLLIGVGAGVLVVATGRLAGALIAHIGFNTAGVLLLLV